MTTNKTNKECCECDTRNGMACGSCGGDMHEQRKNCHQQPEKEGHKCEEDHNGFCYFCGRCMLHPEPSREWELEFDSFVKSAYTLFLSETSERVKSFISKTILSERTALVEEITEAIKNLTFEEAPPFSANDEIRDKAKIINKYLLPAVKERLLSTINHLTKTK